MSSGARPAIWSHDASPAIAAIARISATAQTSSTGLAGPYVTLLGTLRIMVLAALRGALPWLDVRDVSPGSGSGTGPFVIELVLRDSPDLEPSLEPSRACLDTFRRTCEAVSVILLSDAAVQSIQSLPRGEDPCTRYLHTVWHELVRYHAWLMRSVESTHGRLNPDGSVTGAIETLKAWRDKGDLRGWSECEQDGALVNYLENLDVARALEETALAISQFGQRWRQPERDYRPFAMLEAIAAARAARAQRDVQEQA